MENKNSNNVSGNKNSRKEGIGIGSLVLMLLINVFVLASLLTGVGPISRSSSNFIHKMAKENPALNNELYKNISKDSFISINQQKELLTDWLKDGKTKDQAGNP